MSNDDSHTADTTNAANTTDTTHTADDVRKNTPGKGRKPDARTIEPSAPDEFGLVQVWWGGGKGKTTAALGMGFRAAGHGFRVHLLQLMKGGADSVEDVRGEYNAIAAVPGITYENLGHYGWAGMRDGSDEADHATQAEAGFERARELVAAAGEADLSKPLPLDGPAEDGVHMLVVDEVLYAVSMGLLDESAVVDFVESKPENLELVLTGSHERPDYLDDVADLITQVKMEKHPFESGQRARKGTEY